MWRPSDGDAPSATTASRVGIRTVSAQPLLLLLVVAPPAIAYAILRNGGWVYDDNLILVLARHEGFGLGWLNRVLFQHWDVGMNAVYSVMVHLFPLDYRWGLLALLAVLGASILVFERVLALVIGRSWVTVALTMWFGLSILWVRPLQWWASGVQALPTLLCDLVCLYAMLRFCADGRSRWIVLSSGALAVGLLFYEKPALMLVYLALVRVLLMSEALSAAKIASAFWRERCLWLAYAAVVGLWAVGYVASGAYGSASAGAVSIGGYLDYFRILWVDTLVPALAGFTVPHAGLSPLQVVAVVALQLAALGLLIVSVRRKRSAGRAWGFVALMVLLDGGLVANTRVAQFGVAIGGDLRYLLDFAWLLPLAFCAGSSRGGVLRPTVAIAPARLLTRPRLGLAPVVVSLLLAAYAVSAILTAVHLQAGWNSIEARHWEANVQRSFFRLKGKRIHPVVADQEVPFQIISYPFAPLNRLSWVLPLYLGKVQVDGALDGPLMTVDSQGVFHAATEGRSIGDGDTIDLLRAHSLTVGAATVTRTGGQVCVAAGSKPGWVERRLSADRRAPPGPYYLLLRYSSARTFALPLFADQGPGYRQAATNGIAVSSRSKATIGFLGAGLAHRLKLILPPRAALCMRKLDVVALRAG